MRRILALLLGAAICFGGLSLIAGAAEAKTTCPKSHGNGNQYPPGQCKGTTSQSQVCGGKSFTVSGDGFPAGARGDIELDASATSLGSATADASGRISKKVTMPRDATRGAHIVSVYDSVSDRYLTTNITVACDTGAGVSNNAVSKTKGFGMVKTAMVVGAAGLVALAGLGFLLMHRRGVTP